VNTVAIHPVDAPLCELGEGPIWSTIDQVLYWLDVVGKRIFRLDPRTGRVDTRELPYAPSAIVPRRQGGLLLVTKKGLASLHFDTPDLRSHPVPLVDFGNEVFNDGKCDAQGRLWVGTRDIHTAQPNGSLYRLDPDFTMTRHAKDLVVSNGLAWSPDGSTFYHVDSRPGRIDAYDFDPAQGTPHRRRAFRRYEGADGRPDGCTIDAQGHLWVAEVDSWHIRRYRPDGQLDREIRMPFKRPTSLAFGGPTLRTLYVTSMRFGLTAAELAAQPLAGSLLALDVGVAGCPEPAFGG